MNTSLITGDLRDRRALYIGGNWTHGGGPLLRTVSPVTGQDNGVCVTAARADIDAAVAAARHAVDSSRWAVADSALRVEYLGRLHNVYADNKWTMHRLVCSQTGSLSTYTAQVADPLEIMVQTANAVDRAALAVHHDPVEGGNTMFQVRHEPIGVVVAITSWDMPQKTLLAKLAPALATGCAVIIVPSVHSPLDALYLADLAHTVRLPPGVLSVLPMTSLQQPLEYLVKHPGVDKVTFTGSAALGARIAAWRTPGLRPVAVHSGTRSAAIITQDADLPAAVDSLRTLAMGDCGQLRCAVGRLVVHEAVAGEFAEAMRAMMRGLSVGDPALPDTDIGPLVSARHRTAFLDLVQTGHKRGLRLLTGTGVPEGPGFYVYPALFTDVPPGVLPEQDTMLGPVLTLHTFRDDDHAVALANSPTPGLAAAVYCADPRRAHELAVRLRAGTVHINGALPAMHAPAGTFHHGSFGREIGPENLAGFQQIKVVVG